MGRPNKTFHYFAREIDLTNDTRIRRLLRRFGGVAVAVYEEFLAEIYSTGSYFLPWSEDFLLDVSDRLYEEKEKVLEIFNAALDAGLFHKPTFDEFKILTSHGLQVRYAQRIYSISHRKPTLTQYNLLEENQPLQTLPDIDSFCEENPANNRKQGGFAEKSPQMGGVCENLREFAIFCGAKAKDKAKEKVHRGEAKAKAPRARARKPDFLPDSEENSPAQASKTDYSPFDPPDFASDALPEENRVIYQPDEGNDSRGIYGDPDVTTNFDPVSEVIGIWNETFADTPCVYGNIYPTEMLRYQIQQRLNQESDLSVFKQVFQACLTEYRNGDFPWTLPAVFNKFDTFDQLKVKTTLKPKNQKTTVRGLSNPDSYASETEWANYGK